jgi:hypothetical protein
MEHVWGRGDVHTGYWWGNLRERDNLEHLGTDRRIILKLMLKIWDRRRWTGFVWFKTGMITGGLL